MTQKNQSALGATAKSVFIKMIALAVVGTLPGCACLSNVKAAYVSPLKYRNYTCDQLDSNIKKVDQQLEKAADDQDKAVVKEAVALLVCPLVLWPVVLLTMDFDKSDELSQLKGEEDALVSCATEKQCQPSQADIEAEQRRCKDAAEKNAREQQARMVSAGNDAS